MLNVFAQKLKLHLASWSVHGDKTNELGDLKNHLEKPFTTTAAERLGIKTEKNLKTVW